MTMILYVIMLFCIVRTIQEVIEGNYKKAALCLIGTLFLFIAMNGGVYIAVNQLRLAVGDTIFNIIFIVSSTVFTVFVSLCFWKYVKDVSKNL